MRIGILGGGQLGRMLALAGYPLGFQFRVFDPAEDACAGQVAEHVVGNFDDLEGLDRFALGLDVVTFEFENVPVAAAEHLSRRNVLHPNPASLEIAQDRVREKEFFRSIGLETAPFAAIESVAELQHAAKIIGYPCLMKTRHLGYDGKGQVLVNDPDELAPAWQRLGAAPCIVEAYVPFHRELSLLASRDTRGTIEFYPWIENQHQSGILRFSRSPAEPLKSRMAEGVMSSVATLMQQLEYVGVLAVEFFEVGEALLANEMAPRVHNSGHWTIDGARTSQFENHIRAVTGMPLGGCEARSHAGMVNLIGTVPSLGALLAIDNAHVHLYGKEPRSGRKVGHVNVVASTAGERDAALAIVASSLG